MVTWAAVALDPDWQICFHIEGGLGVRDGNGRSPSIMLSIINSKAAAADVGSEAIYVSIAGRAPRKFGTLTRDLEELRDYLSSEGVNAFAMEFTGVYWIPLYEILEKTPIKLCLVNGAHVKRLPGRKTDVSDCQWMAELHAHGLLKPGFVPGPEIRRLRDYCRLRDGHIARAASHVLQMEKALDLMNIKIHDVLSDLVGVSGRRMVQAILQGERNTERLLELCDRTVLQKKRQRLCDALQGTWATQHLFALQQAWDAWQFFQQQIEQCDGQIRVVLEEMARQSSPTPPERGEDGGKPPKRPSKNAPKIADLHGTLLTVLGGRNPGCLPGLTDYTVLQLVSEVGTDLSAFPTEKHFTSWLGLAPGTNNSGKRHRRKSRKGGRAGQLFRNVAQTVGRSTTMGLGLFYRRIRSLRGGLVASKALGRKLAELYYRVMTKGMRFVEEGLAKAEKRQEAILRQRLERNATRLGYKLVPARPIAV
jgi:transposase